MSTFHSYNFSDGAGLYDASGRTLLQFDTNASAVNSLQIANTATGSNVVVSVIGDDNNVGLDLLPKNGGNVNILSTSTQGGLRFYRGTDSQASGFVGLTGPSSGDNTVYTLPSSDGTTGQYLKTDGNGVLSFDTVSGGGGVGDSSTTEILFNNAGTVDGLSNVTVTADGILIAANEPLKFGDSGEYISGNGTSLTVGSGAGINLTAGTNVQIPSGIPLQFADSGETIYGNGTDLTLTSCVDINLTATNDVNIPVNVGLTFGADTFKVESDSTDLTIASAGDINLTATNDVNITANVGLTFGADTFKVESDSTDLTVSSAGAINLTATTDVVIPANVGLTFDTDGSEKIESNDTNLTVSSGVGISLSAEKLIMSSQTLTVGSNSGDLSSTSANSNSLTAPVIFFNAVSGSTAATYPYQFTPTTSNVAGEIKHLFFDNSAQDTVLLRIDFGANVLASGSGLAQYLTFGVNGQSATLINIGSKWRIINTGAAVS